MRRVVITGVGTVNPIGNSVNQTWDSIIKKYCGIDEIKSFDASNLKVKLAGEIKNLNLEDYFDKKEIKHTDRFSLISKIAYLEALKDSKLDLSKIDHNKLGVILGSGIGGLITIEETLTTAINRGYDRISPYFIPKSLINLLAGNIAIMSQAYGYVNGVVTACAASTNAIGDSFHRIKHGYEDIIITGGSEAAICKLGISGFSSMRALYSGTDKTRASIPFDKERSGFVMGEGSGILILEELDHAIARNAKIYGEIVGYGVSCDAYHITAPKGDGTNVAKAMFDALNEANINPSMISYYNAHGTSTQLNDKVETKAIKFVFKDSLDKLSISSTKGNTGHLLGASGAVETIISLMAMNKSIIPPTINYKEKDIDCDLDYSTGDLTSKNIEYFMKNSLGFGGHNASLIIKKWK